jgi:hypothetical protein
MHNISSYHLPPDAGVGAPSDRFTSDSVRYIFVVQKTIKDDLPLDIAARGATTLYTF